MSVTNIAAYKFASLEDLKPLRERLLDQCKTWGLKGTILLSTEGINLFVAGGADEIDLLLKQLRSVPGLEDLAPKISLSDDQPFNRMLVKIKREIISFGVEGINPARRTSPKLKARELKQWLDEGRPVTLLDTRNDYEVKLGTFHNAVTVNIEQFRQFPEAVRTLPEELKRQPIVMFCTGGIRCEKAGPFMEREGFEQIFQLDGGILKYFEECGNAHYDGECFVFDQRVGLDPTLQETASDQCFACLSPLTFQDLRDERYVAGKSCPYCYRSDSDQAVALLVQRHEAIRRVTSPLPGSVPYDNYRPLTVPREYDGRTLMECASGIFDHIPRDEWQLRFDQGRMLTEQRHPVGPDWTVHTGERYLQWQPGLVEPDVNADIRVLYEDESILVVHKPAPLPMHPCGRFNRNTLQHILTEVYRPLSPKAAHRLDANTSGLVILSKTRHVAGLIQPQFARGEVDKRYLAKVHGHPEQDQFSCQAPISAVSGDLGSRQIDEEEGLASQTDFRVVARQDDGTSLLEVTPHTGRTNQIRVHLWHLGHPIVGDPTYLPDHRLGETQTHDVESSPLCLLAHQITFTHPTTRQRVTFTAEVPDWAKG